MVNFSMPYLIPVGVAMTSQDKFLTSSEVANLFKVVEKTVYGPSRKGDLPGFKVGGQWRFCERQLIPGSR